jgi:hypothetical protein
MSICTQSPKFESPKYAPDGSQINFFVIKGLVGVVGGQNGAAFKSLHGILHKRKEFNLFFWRTFKVKTRRRVWRSA